MYCGKHRFRRGFRQVPFYGTESEPARRRSFFVRGALKLEAQVPRGFRQVPSGSANRRASVPACSFSWIVGMVQSATRVARSRVCLIWFGGGFRVLHHHSIVFSHTKRERGLSKDNGSVAQMTQFFVAGLLRFSGQESTRAQERKPTVPRRL